MVCSKKTTMSEVVQIALSKCGKTDLDYRRFVIIPYIYLSILTFILLSIFIYPFIKLSIRSIYSSIHSSIYPFIHPFIYLSIYSSPNQLCYCSSWWNSPTCKIPGSGWQSDVHKMFYFSLCTVCVVYKNPWEESVRSYSHYKTECKSVYSLKVDRQLDRQLDRQTNRQTDW